jgi:hypothetical protein
MQVVSNIYWQNLWEGYFWINGWNIVAEAITIPVSFVILFSKLVSLINGIKDIWYTEKVRESHSFNNNFTDKMEDYKLKMELFTVMQIKLNIWLFYLFYCIQVTFRQFSRFQTFFIFDEPFLWFIYSIN